MGFLVRFSGQQIQLIVAKDSERRLDREIQEGCSRETGRWSDTQSL